MIPKIFSKIINYKLTPIFKNILIPQQHGFRCNISTLINLINFKHFILPPFSNDSQIDTIFTDFEKAFNSIE
jgi:hypothetical protein